MKFNRFGAEIWGRKSCPEYAAVISGFLKLILLSIISLAGCQVSVWLVIMFFWTSFCREVCLLVCTGNIILNRYHDVM